MRSVRRIAAIGARQVWLWRHEFGMEPAAEQPRLLVDVSAIMQHDARTGIQRVVRAVWSELNRRSGDGFRLQPVFATNTHGYCCASADFLERKPGGDLPQTVKVRSGDKFLGLDLSAHLLPHYRRQLRAWKANGATIHLMVYDLLPLQRPDWFSAATAANFRRWYEVLSSDADQAICISDQVAHDLRLRLRSHDSSPSVTKVSMGADIGASVPSSGISQELSGLLDRLSSKSAILMVGTIEPRKGYDVALAAFEHLWRTRPTDAPDLIIVGRPGWKTAALQRRLREHRESGARLHWLTGVSDQGLCKLYDACSGVFIASHAEGFGLPLIEAGMFRRHVLARDLPVFRQQRLANVTFFDNDSPAALGQRLMDLVASANAAPARVVKVPTWSECVDGLLRAIGAETATGSITHQQLRQAC
jgi:glycosyltransferase involved in cell wall biosynthesis